MEWISVEDRLPDIGAPVIATMKTDNTDFDSEWWYGCCVYREFGFPWVQIDNPNPITHWMPLPKPPQL